AGAVLPLALRAFDLLAELAESKKNPYDLIVLDPPAFTKSRKTVSGAERGYRQINARAMKLLPRGGYLATCSCSHFMGSERFEDMLGKAARDAGVQLRQVEALRQAGDHPILWNVPETDYLKFYIFQVI
ncbi:MAG TPA: class I SAM-dependent methyltransferase, partial [Clostridia bacterium]|nr:class I SAM-dependent methyltransferase [Clostridia bacterium]